MSDAHIFLGNSELGELFRVPHRAGERITFRYGSAWLSDPAHFALDPELHLDARSTTPARGGLFGALSDVAPDRWGRQLMQRRERRLAQTESRPVRTLSELDFVLGVSDFSRLGALRLWVDGKFVADGGQVPLLVQLGALLDAATRITRGEETDQDFSLIFAPGSSLGGARPKASVLDAHGALAIAKFPRDGDEYSVELWEQVALVLARAAGIHAANSRLERVGKKHVLLSQRFDRKGETRVHFASALTLLNLRDGDHASYPELAELLQREGSQPRADAEELFRRMVFNISIANVDDHLRNHGFLREPRGWRLSPAYDLNPVPADLKPRILSTNITLDDATGSLEAALESAPYFGLDRAAAEAVIAQVLAQVARWQTVARTLGATKAECQRMESAFLSI